MKKNMSILITGAASGIGRAAAELAASLGHRVYALDINESSSEGLAGSFVADITDGESLEGVRSALESDGIKLDAIITAAGVHAMASLVEDDFAKIERLMNINLTGTMRTVNAIYPLLGDGGRIVMLTSEVATLDPLPFNGLYSISKCALESYAQALRQELNLIGQRVVTVRPGAIATPLAGASIKATEDLA